MKVIPSELLKKISGGAETVATTLAPPPVLAPLPQISVEFSPPPPTSPPPAPKLKTASLTNSPASTVAVVEIISTHLEKMGGLTGDVTL